MHFRCILCTLLYSESRLQTQSSVLFNYQTMLLQNRRRLTVFNWTHRRPFWTDPLGRFVLSTWMPKLLGSFVFKLEEETGYRLSGSTCEAAKTAAVKNNGFAYVRSQCVTRDVCPFSGPLEIFATISPEHTVYIVQSAAPGRVYK